MTYRGKVVGGKVVLPADAHLPDGAEVDVIPFSPPATTGHGDHERPTLAERFKDFIGVCKGLPADLAENHDHYLYGTPKRKR
ncbi:MAG: hypothetical protein FJ272_14875 [Planctomycetes bacterium]|nr:hypothetical protein [Planctomycetota bacterium]